ncbi:hypothetical protein [Rhodopirellula sp. MGV]|uniref:hypothetical protein n=1 Tax=Rhodopirellula sp. MGV TaxID=2023130 RepID=UPI000BCC4CDE|nr:hypothetical protein [Rhodopirellula sp. MGV]OYP38836.1 hypothetical protein CGZ80_01040 [Rhodopirellula sp. MGV]
MMVSLGSSTPTALAWDPAMPVADGDEPLEFRLNLLTESSGLAFSLRNSAYVWTHNDSGDLPRLFSFDEHGQPCGRLFLRGVKAIDWEDMDCFDDEGPRLLIADVGDNDNNRDSVSLYLLNEPNPTAKSRLLASLHLTVTYANGPQNCEAVAVDVHNRRILLLGKSAILATLHEIALPSLDEWPEESRDRKKAKHIAVKTTIVRRLPIPLATGMDICERTGDLWISSYLNAYQYKSAIEGDLFTRLGGMPTIVELPKLKQIEAIAIDGSDRVWVSSEGLPAQMQRVK